MGNVDQTFCPKLLSAKRSFDLFCSHFCDINHSSHVLAKWCQRRRLKKSANQKQDLPVAAMFVNSSERNEQSLLMTFHRCFLRSFISFGQGVKFVEMHVEKAM
jgi:hypothetical protein